MPLVGERPLELHLTGEEPVHIDRRDPPRLRPALANLGQLQHVVDDVEEAVHPVRGAQDQPPGTLR